MAGTFKEALLRASLLGGICHCLISPSYGMEKEEGADRTEISIPRIKHHKAKKPSLADIERLHQDHSLLTAQYIDRWITFAETGDLVSLYHLGWLIDKREKSTQVFGEKDKAHASILVVAKTFYWWKRAQNQDDLEAWIELGILFHNDLGVEKDHGETMKCYLKEVEQNLEEENMGKKDKLGLPASALGLLQVEASAMESGEDSDKKVINSIRKSVSEKTSTIKTLKLMNKAEFDDEKTTKTQEYGIAIFGQNGMRKSTLFNYFLGVPLWETKTPKNIGLIIEPKGKKDCKSDTSSGFNSNTTLSTREKNHYDFEGSRSTGKNGLDQDIVNAYSIYKLLLKTANMKILVVVSKDDLNLRDNFIPSILQLAGMFPSVDAILLGLCLVITKRKDFESLYTFQELLKANCEDVVFTEEERKITAVDFRNKFRNFSEYFKEISAESKFDDQVQAFQKLLVELSPELGSKLTKFFLNFVTPEIVHNAQNLDWDNLYNIHHYIKDLSTEPEFNTNFSIFTGALIGTSGVNQMVDVNNFSQLKINSTHSILFDENLEMPGCTIVLDADHWFVLGNHRKVNLKGADGKDRTPLITADEEGFKENGEGNDRWSGRRRKKGCHFEGKGKEFDNPKSLTIDVNGGNGAVGKDGVIGDKQDVWERKLCVEREEHQSDDKHSGNIKQFLEVYESGSLGTLGGSGGEAGEGGMSGDKGDAILNNKKPDGIFKEVKEDKGDEGKPGEPGEKGDTGADGIVYQGTLHSAEYSSLEIEMSGIKPFKRSGEQLSGNNAKRSIGLVLKDTAIGGGLGILIYVLTRTGQKVPVVITKILRETVRETVGETATEIAGNAATRLAEALGLATVSGVGATSMVILGEMVGVGTLVASTTGSALAFGVGATALLSGGFGVVAIGLGVKSIVLKVTGDTIREKIVERIVEKIVGETIVGGATAEGTALYGVLGMVGFNLLKVAGSYISASAFSDWKDEPQIVKQQGKEEQPSKVLEQAKNTLTAHARGIEPITEQSAYLEHKE